MANLSSEWTVRGHGPIEQLAENLWWVQGDVPRMPIKRNMVVVRRTDGSLLVHNAIALREVEQAQLEALGTPAILIVPNGFHRLDAPAYKARYPRLRVFAPAGARTKIESVLPVDGTYADFPADEATRVEHLGGVREAEGALVVSSKDGTTVVVNDAVFNMDPPRGTLSRIAMTVLNNAGGPRVSRLTKLLLVKDRAAFRATLEKYAALPDLQRFIVAHDKCVVGREAAAAALRTAAASI